MELLLERRDDIKHATPRTGWWCCDVVVDDDDVDDELCSLFASVCNLSVMLNLLMHRQHVRVFAILAFRWN